MGKHKAAKARKRLLAKRRDANLHRTASRRTHSVKVLENTPQEASKEQAAEQAAEIAAWREVQDAEQAELDVEK